MKCVFRCCDRFGITQRRNILEIIFLFGIVAKKSALFLSHRNKKKSPSPFPLILSQTQISFLFISQVDENWILFGNPFLGKKNWKKKRKKKLCPFFWVWDKISQKYAFLKFSAFYPPSVSMRQKMRRFFFATNPK